MSIVEKIASALSTGQRVPLEQLRSRLTEAEAELARARNTAQAVAGAAEGNEPGAAKALATARQDEAAAEARIRNLRDAIAGAERMQVEREAAAARDAERQRAADYAAALGKLHDFGGRMDRHFAQGAVLSEEYKAIEDALTAADPRIRTVLADVNQRLLGCAIWHLRAWPNAKAILARLAPFQTDESARWSQYLPRVDTQLATVHADEHAEAVS